MDVDPLRQTSEHLWLSHDLRAGLDEMIDAGISLIGADRGNFQLLNPGKEVLEIVRSRKIRKLSVSCTTSSSRNGGYGHGDLVLEGGRQVGNGNPAPVRAQ